ncbi:hypothetical protein FRB95_013242 [Tulasnella sp. JGI-2019a]|nr:hypothetical protein FRB95_013242 [Tulasnella sp. JGI-2019a]
MTHIKAAEHPTCLMVATTTTENSFRLLQLLARKQATILRWLWSVHFRDCFDGIAIADPNLLLIMGRSQANKRTERFTLGLARIPLLIACGHLCAIPPQLPLDLFITRDTTFPLKILGRTHNITSITLKNNSGRNILAYLAGPPDTDNDGLPLWRCPRLEILCFSDGVCDGSVSLLAAFLTKRYTHLDLAVLDEKDMERGLLAHKVVLCGHTPTESEIRLLTQQKLSGVHVKV